MTAQSTFPASLSRTSRPGACSLAIALASSVLATGLLAAGCEAPNRDTFRRFGGASPDPTGVMEGTVLYVGPRPQCEWEDATDPDGDPIRRPTRVRGNVLLLLFEYDNPPPPTGSATSAQSLLTVPGDQMFSLGDCMPEVPMTAADRATIMRSASFTWPELALGRDPCRTNEEGVRTCPPQSYQVRGFFDYDDDFNPFFSVRNLATAGDVAGGAFVSTTAVPPQFLEIRFNHIDDTPNGQVVQGVAVTLGVVVNTQRPSFQLSETTRALRSDDTIPVGDLIVRERTLYERTSMQIEGIGASTIDSGEPVSEAFAAAGIDTSDWSRANTGFYIRNVDANNDGANDTHPILGADGTVLWYYPAIISRRARNPIELAVGIPDALLIGSIRPTEVAGLMTGGIGAQVRDRMDVVMPPVVAVVTNPELGQTCRVPYIPPGNLGELYERIPVDCQELPTGNYDVNVLSGVAGGVSRDEREFCLFTCCHTACTGGGMTPAQCDMACAPGMRTDSAACTGECDFRVPAVTSTGFTITGGSFPSQAWSIPNDLGCPDIDYRAGALNQLDVQYADGSFPECGNPMGDQDGDDSVSESVLLPHQGPRGRFSVVEADPATVPDETMGGVPHHGVDSCETALHGTTGMTTPVIYRAIDPACCPPTLMRLCGLPLCPARSAADDPFYPEAVREGHDGGGTRTREIRVEGEDFVRNPNGTITPLCVPFLMPGVCCGLCDGSPEQPAGCPDTAI